MSTKRDLVKNLSKKLDYLDPEDIKHAVNYILNYLKEELSKGNRVEIRGFGSICLFVKGNTPLEMNIII